MFEIFFLFIYKLVKYSKYLRQKLVVYNSLGVDEPVPLTLPQSYLVHYSRRQHGRCPNTARLRHQHLYNINIKYVYLKFKNGFYFILIEIYLLTTIVKLLTDFTVLL